VLVELSQPEVHVVPARHAGAPAGAPCQKEQAACCPKTCSFLNLSINKVHSKSLGGAPGVPQAVTTVVPAYATATIPIALQTTRFTTEVGVAETVRREAALSRSDIAELVREAMRREAAQQREAAPQPEAAPRQEPCADVCAELKTRVDQIEKRLGQIEKQVKGIETKLNQLP
jgi:hypothetical protein